MKSCVINGLVILNVPSVIKKGNFVVVTRDGVKLWYYGQYSSIEDERFLNALEEMPNRCYIWADKDYLGV